MKHYGGSESRTSWHNSGRKQVWLSPGPGSKFLPSTSLRLMHAKSTVKAILHFVALFSCVKNFRTWIDINAANWKLFSKICYFKAQVICGNIAGSTETLFTGLLRETWQLSVPWNLVHFLPLLWVFCVNWAKVLYYLYTLLAHSFRIYCPQRQNIHIS